MTREQKLQQLEKLQRLEQLEAEEAQAVKRDESPVKEGIKSAIGGIQGAASFQQRKGVSPIFAKALSQATGKPEAQLLGPSGQEALPAEIIRRAGGGIPRSPTVADAMGAIGSGAMNALGSPSMAAVANAWAQTKNKEDPWWNTSPGGIADVAIDTLTDPLTYETAVLSRAAKLGKLAGPGVTGILQSEAPVVNTAKLGARVANRVVNPFETYNNASAVRNYGNAFEKLDRAAKLNEKPIMPSQIAMDRGYVGTMRGAEDMLTDVNREAGQKLGALRQQMTDRGVKVNAETEVAPHIFEQADEMAGKAITPEQRARAESLRSRAYDSLFPDYPNRPYTPQVPIQDAADAKAFLNSEISRGGGVYPDHASSERMAGMIASSNALTQGEEAAIKRMAPDLWPEFEQQKKMYSSSAPLISDRAEMLGNQVAERRNPFVPTQVDAMLAGSGLLANEPGAIGALAAKKGLNFFTSTPGRTFRGRLARDLGRAGSYGLIDSGIRHNPWKLDVGE